VVSSPFDVPWLVADDYRDALVLLAWQVERSHRSLVFGLVELFPPELPPPDPRLELRLSYRERERNPRIYVEGFRLPIDRVLDWYANCCAGTVTLPIGEGVGADEVILAHAAFSSEPPWPHLVATNDLPFLGGARGTVRAHHLFQVDKPSAIDLLMGCDEAVRWLSDRLFFDLKTYPEWVGSVHLVAPNPVFRELDRRREVSADGMEATRVRFVARAGKALDGLRLHLTEHGQTGVTAAHSIQVAAPDTRVPHTGVAESVGHTVVCPRRGVLDWGPPTPYISRVEFTLDISSGVKTVHVPTVPGRPGETYHQPLLVSTLRPSPVQAPATESPGTYLRRAQLARKSRLENQERAEEWFHGDPDAATRFVRGLIAAARDRVWIVDPYFATVELFRFALAIARPDIDVTILTSAKHLKEGDRLRSDADPGAVLLDEIDRLREHGRFTAFVMLGDAPAVHDRFLVIDDAVWFSGNSLHTLGGRAGMIVRLAHPRPIIEALDDIIQGDRVESLEEWVVADRRNASSPHIPVPATPDSIPNRRPVRQRGGGDT